MELYRFRSGKQGFGVRQKLAVAEASESKVGMASTRRVTVRASRTRPGPQTR